MSGLHRTLWQKLLTLHKDVTTATSILKTCGSYAASVGQLTAEVTNVCGFCENQFSDLQSKLASFTNFFTAKKELDTLHESGKTDTNVSSKVLLEMEEAQKNLTQWAEKTLCPQLPDFLTEIAGWCDAQIASVSPESFGQQAAEAYPGTLPQAPDSVLTQEFRLRCRLDLLYPRWVDFGLVFVWV